MRASVASAVFCLPAALALPARAQVRSTIIGPGVKRYPIAVSPLKEFFLLGPFTPPHPRAVSNSIPLPPAAKTEAIVWC